MANFNELNFYDGTLNTNLSLEEAHAKVVMMRKDVEKKAAKVRNLRTNRPISSIGCN